MDPQPIATAPTDGTVVLTDCGLARALSENERSWYFTRPPAPSWVICWPGGNEISDSDHGPEYCNPTLWAPLPDWIK